MKPLTFTIPSTRSVHAGKLVFVTATIILISLFFSLSSQAQEYKSKDKKFYKAYYKKRNAKYTNACNELERKRHQKPKKVLVRNRKPRPMAEVDPTTAVAKVPVTKPQPKVAPISTPVPKPLP